MNVYLHGSPDKLPQARHTLLVTPAAHLSGQELPVEFVDHEGKPRLFEVLFEHGKAEVTDQLGKYLVAHGLAQKTRLVVPGVYS